MAPGRSLSKFSHPFRPWIGTVLICLGWIILIATAIAPPESVQWSRVALLSILPALWTFLVLFWINRRFWAGSLPRAHPDRRICPSAKSGFDAVPSATPAQEDSMTGSGLYDSPLDPGSGIHGGFLSGEFSITDMVDRLDPRSFHWIESSFAEQEFLGWSLSELHRRSFLDIVHLDDRPRAEEALRQTVTKGECLGLVVRIRTAQGKTKAVEVNAGARYAADHHVTYLRCHLTDVTEKVRAERELRLRTRELIQVNEQLRQINRELVELKDRYTDLYENAPAMYFSVDSQGNLTECNQTLLATLKRRAEDLVGHSFEKFLEPTDLDRCRRLFARLLEVGSLETEAQWVRSSGEVIDVWISGRVVRGPRDAAVRTRCVAQDLTAKRHLEAELRATNDSLKRANTELSGKNRELDEFVYVVSHDLQEPLRTLSAFSEYLLQDHAERLGPEGSHYVRLLVEASRRMRSMIGGLLKLSRAGKVTEEFAPVDLSELVEVVKTDLGELIRRREATVRLLDSDVVLWGDRRRLEQLLANLVSNGIKYNRSQVPSVEIGLLALSHHSAEPSPWTTIFVRDNGIGIDPRHHQKIFQLFRRLHTQEEFEGTGVGLAICSKIVQAHGGQMCLESAPGAGSTFYFSLPRAPDSDAPSAPSASSSRNPASAE
jgi:PAS domain S-box-containing protein